MGDKMFGKYNQEVQAHAVKRAQYFEKAAAAYKEGNGSLAKDLAEK